MRYPKFRGLRNRARGRIDFSSPVVQENLQFLESHKLIFETGLDQHTRKKIVLLAKTYPKLTIIINHLGDGRLDADNHPQVWWPPLMAQLGSCSNVYCKLSMFDHVFKNDFAPERLDALFDPLLKAFGPDRLLYGSNWPVSPDYTAMFSLFAKQLDANPDLKEQILTTNPIKAYRLEFNP